MFIIMRNKKIANHKLLGLHFCYFFILILDLFKLSINQEAINGLSLVPNVSVIVVEDFRNATGRITRA